jgi:hypothetical protein
MAALVPDVGGFSFWHRQVGLLGDRDPVRVLAETPEVLRQVASEHRPGTFALRPFDGKWTPAEIVGHLIDVEWIFGFRTRTTLADRDPEFGGVDQDRWVAAQRWSTMEPTVLVESFAALRGVNLAWWNSLSRTDLERSGRHTEAGVALTLGQLRSILAGHDLLHLDQLRRFLEATT